MSNSLYELIARRIASDGPISIAAYMELCLSHPEYGYYRQRDPLGVAGDFTTAPEISQLFGEMIGLWVADLWIRIGRPARLILCECGPGRGTLMADILRVTGKIDGLNDRLDLHLVETNPVLIDRQKRLIEKAEWHASPETLPADAPVVVIGNEFLDALPLRQLIRTGNVWRERMVALENGKLVFVLWPEVTAMDLPDADEGAIHEFSPLREAVWTDICRRVSEQKGAALMIDYGYTEPQKIDTFQAVQNHVFANVLENPGEQDLTSHVNFGKLAELAKPLEIQGPVSQASFLKNLGIEIRAEKLIAANPEKKDEILAGLRRLTHRDEMGSLFKAISVYNL